MNPLYAYNPYMENRIKQKNENKKSKNKISYTLNEGQWSVEKDKKIVKQIDLTNDIKESLTPEIPSTPKNKFHFEKVYSHSEPTTPKESYLSFPINNTLFLNKDFTKETPKISQTEPSTPTIRDHSMFNSLLQRLKPSLKELPTPKIEEEIIQKKEESKPVSQAYQHPNLSYYKGLSSVFVKNHLYMNKQNTLQNPVYDEETVKKDETEKTETEKQSLKNNYDVVIALYYLIEYSNFEDFFKKEFPQNRKFFSKFYIITNNKHYQTLKLINNVYNYNIEFIISELEMGEAFKQTKKMLMYLYKNPYIFFLQSGMILPDNFTLVTG